MQMEAELHRIWQYFSNFRYRDWKTLACLIGIGCCFASMAMLVPIAYPGTNPDNYNSTHLLWSWTAVPFAMAAFDLITGYLSRWTALRSDRFSWSNPDVLWHAERELKMMRTEFVQRDAQLASVTTDALVRIVLAGASDSFDLHQKRRSLVEALLLRAEKLELSDEEVRTAFGGFDPAVFADVVEERYGLPTTKPVASTLLALARSPSRLLTRENLHLWNASKLQQVASP